MPDESKKVTKTKYQNLLEVLIDRNEVELPFSVFDDTITIMIGDWALELNKNGKWDIG